jgi:PHD/YefM family antitoxin component YafN of YafNO toxin-antitoxin module
MAITVQANAVLMSVSELKKSPTQAIDGLAATPGSPVYILNRNEPVASLVSTDYVARKEALEKENATLTDELLDQKYQIIALQRLLNDTGKHYTDHEVRGDDVDMDLSSIEDEWE